MKPVIQLSPSAERKLSRWVFSGFFVLGCVMAFGGATWWWRRVDYVRGGSPVDATVIKVEAGPSGGKGPPPSFAVFRFSDARGRMLEIRSQSDISGENLRVGSRVRLIYNAALGTWPLLDRPNYLYGPPLFVTGFGTVFALASFVGIRRSSRI